MLSLDTGHERDYREGMAYRDYIATDRLMFSVPELDDRLDNKDEVLALRFCRGPRRTAWRSRRTFLSQNRVYHDALGGREFVVLTDRSGASRVYESGGRRFVRWDGDGAVWEEGRGGGGRSRRVGSWARRVQRLDRLPAHRAFWFGWYAQYPGTRLVRR